MVVDFSKLLNIFLKNWPLFWHGIKYTCLFAIVGTFCGLVIGLITGGLGALEINDNDKPIIKVAKSLCLLIVRFYIWVFRGTPMMVQAVFLYYLLKPVLNWNSLTAGLVIISVNTGAYMAEIVRAGIQSVDNGQFEACKSIGLNFVQSLIHVILPQAIINSFPSIGNQLIVNIKDSSMLNVLSITELFFQTASIAGSNYRYIETYLISALVYLVLTSLASYCLNWLETRLNNGERNKKVMEYAS